jgi:glycosyltransferase involved in cell wall biosynthesis
MSGDTRPVLAFHAPLKPPDHPNPSGDRAMARLVMAALAAAGFDVRIVSRLRTLDRTGDAALMQTLDREAAAEVAAWLGALQPENRPAVMLTYHCHYKAPDLVGPRIAAALGIPYAIVEPSRAPKRAHGPWAEGHRLAEAAIDRADILFAMTDRNRPMLEALRPPRQRIVALPPFLDVAAWPLPERRARRAGEPPRLLTVAMMRPGDKLASYLLLAEALRLLQHRPWTLEVVGDGAARAEVTAAFAALGERVRWHGLVDERATLSALYAGADLLLWPAVNEAYGMVFLEAQLHGVVPLAGREGGVAAVVRDGETGLLVPPRDAAAFAAALDGLLADTASLGAMGEAARRFVAEERTLAAAAGILRGALLP